MRVFVEFSRFGPIESLPPSHTAPDSRQRRLRVRLADASPLTAAEYHFPLTGDRERRQRDPTTMSFLVEPTI